jgi:outer membrane protein OmpA-like peptidoglycan-associated protein
MKRVIVLFVLIVVGCGTEPTRHPPGGPPLTAVTEDEARALLNDLRLDLQDVSLAQVGGKTLEPSTVRGQLQIELSAPALFEQNNAQVRAEALKPLAEIAQDVGARGGCVVHVLSFSGDDAGADLAERRAAAVADVFAHRSVAASRLRFESRVEGKPGDRIVIVLKPVIIGRESPAWMRPVLQHE